MAKDARYNFNRGLLSPLALGRQDLDRTSLAAALQTNWLPRVLGSMMLRPGLKFIGETDGSNKAKFIPFVFSSEDTALIEFADSSMRVWVNETPIHRATTGDAITNAYFNADLTGWTDSDEAGATSSWLTDGAGGGYLAFIGTGYNRAIRKQHVSVAQDVEHGLQVIVRRGPVTLRVGSTDGGDDYFAESDLGTGHHSLSVTPTTTDFYIQVSSRKTYTTLLDSIDFEVTGDMALFDHIDTLSEAQLPYLRYAASGDVTWIARNGFAQLKVERRAPRSWSLVRYETDDGPFRIENIISSLQLTPSARTGNITLTSSAPLFKSTHVGALFRIESIGQRVDLSANGANQFTDEIRVTGVGDSRTFFLVVGGTWVATWTLQRSIGDPGVWTDVTSGTGNGTTQYNDGLDNQIIYYRIGIKAGDYTSGTAIIYLEFSGGSIPGIVRVTAYSSTTSVSAVVLSHLGSIDASDVWSEGAWSDYRGWPSAVALYEGRLWWAGKNKIWGSISDAYDSFDDTIEGAKGTLSRSIGEGPVDGINWLLPLERLLMGTAGAERYVHSSSQDEPLSPTEFDLKRFSTQGSAQAVAVSIDTEGLFIQRSSYKVYSMMYKDYGYSSIDMTALVPEMGSPGFTHIAVQRQPDTRVHCVRSDGTVGVLVYDFVESVRCWVEVETDGVVEDVVVLPGSDGEDAVYYVVKRDLGGEGGIVRYLERWALEAECRGGALNKQADSFVVYSGAPVSTISGLDHLEGQEVVIWGDGADLGTSIVVSGGVTLSDAVSNAVVGLYYEARYQSTKLKELDVAKRIHHLGLLLNNTHAQGIQYGSDFDNLDDLPLIEEGDVVPTGTIWEAYHEDSVPFSGTFGVDSRVCLKAAAPRPVTVIALTMEFE